MESKNIDGEDLRIKLEQVIERSNAQKKILRKILNQLNKNKGDNGTSKTVSKTKET